MFFPLKKSVVSDPCFVYWRVSPGLETGYNNETVGGVIGVSSIEEKMTENWLKHFVLAFDMFYSSSIKNA